MSVSMKKVVLAVLLAAAMSLSVVPLTLAEEKKMDTSHNIKQILDAFNGKRVILKTDAGEAIEGTVTSVGDYVVHISKLAGKDFYDAVVVIQKINSVVFKAR